MRTKPQMKMNPEESFLYSYLTDDPHPQITAFYIYKIHI